MRCQVHVIVTVPEKWAAASDVAPRHVGRRRRWKLRARRSRDVGRLGRAGLGCSEQVHDT